MIERTIAAIVVPAIFGCIPYALLTRKANAPVYLTEVLIPNPSRDGACRLLDNR